MFGEPLGLLPTRLTNIDVIRNIMRRARERVPNMEGELIRSNEGVGVGDKRRGVTPGSRERQ